MNPLLQELLADQTTRARRRHLQRACRAILKSQDLDPLIDKLRKNPQSAQGLPLLLDLATADQVKFLWKTWQDCEHLPVGALELAGRHQIQEACTAAWRVALGGDWHEQCEAILCLSNLELESIASSVRARLDKMEGKALFLELLPALAPKVGWPGSLTRLRQWASLASTDCLGGIVTGIGSCQPTDAARIFEELLRNPRFEIFGGGTGLERFSEPAGRRLGFDLVWLTANLRDTLAGSERDHLFRVFLSWIRVRLVSSFDALDDTPKPLSFQEVYSLAFDWGADPNRDGSLRAFCPPEFRDTYRLLESQLEQAAVLELILSQPI